MPADSESSSPLAQAIVDTIREPLLVLDQDLTVQVASRSFYAKFATSPDDTIGTPLFQLGHGRWDIPALRHHLGRIIPDNETIEAFEVQQHFAALGKRILLLNARSVFDERNNATHILLAMEDVTERRAAEQALRDTADERHLMLREMQHRIKNTLAMIVGLLGLQSRDSHPETTRQFDAVRRRVLAIAKVHDHLFHADPIGRISLRSYFRQLTDDLSKSLVSPNGHKLELVVDDIDVDADKAITLGLVANEVVTNAVKHAFPDRIGRVDISIRREEAGLRLQVSDDGIGMPEIKQEGLGTKLLPGLVAQLQGELIVSTGEGGTICAVVVPRLE